MGKQREPDLYKATTTFATTLDGVPTIVNKGELVRNGHQLLKQNPEYFEAADLDVKYDVEDTSASPGTKRSR